MATLDEVCQAIPSALAQVPGVKFYEFVPDATIFPAVVVWPQEGEWVAMGRGFDEHQIDLYILVSRAVADKAQSELRQFIHQLRAAVWTNKTLGLTNTNAHISGYSRFGGNFEAQKVPHIGAVLRLVVRTPGTP